MKSSLPVVESFHSLQGEGAHTGRSAFFIRLASCNVGCPWCDTKNSWVADRHPEKNVNELSNEVLEANIKGAGFVVITGGEPLHHNLDGLCRAIRQKNKMPIHIETSGVDKLSGNPDWITLSPKRHAPPEIEILVACQEIKIIIQEKIDLVFAETIIKKIKSHSSRKPLLFLQAGWNNIEGQQLAFEYVRSHPEWRLSMQTHKWLKID